MDDLHEVDDANVVMELEEAADTFAMEEESDTKLEPMSEVMISELRKLYEHRESKFRHGVGSTHVKQFALVQKMDPKRLMDDLEDEKDCHAHEWVHCETCLSIPWKIIKKHVKGPSKEVDHIAQCVVNDTC